MTVPVMDTARVRRPRSVTLVRMVAMTFALDVLTKSLAVGLMPAEGVPLLGDRVFRAPGSLQGHVVDFLAIGGSPVFNAADAGIVCGAVILAWCSATRSSAADPSGTPTAWSWEYRPTR